MRALALHARRLAGTPELPALLAELSARGPYERRTALHMAMAARDLGHIAAVLAGPDLDLRRAALRAVRTLPVPDEAAEAVLRDAPTELRRAFYRTLLHARRGALADRLLPQVRERWGDREAAALLPACSGPVVAEALSGLEHAVVAWRALGRRHPGPVLDTAEAETRGITYAWYWWRTRGAGIEAAAEHAPERVLSLLEHMERRTRTSLLPALSPAAATALSKADPARTARLLLRGSWRRYPGVRPGLLTHLRAVPAEEIVRRAPATSYRLGTFLEALPPGVREPAFDAAVERGDDVLTGLRALPFLPLLPPARAAAEARRMLDWHGSAWHSSRSHSDDPDLPLKLQAFLPYEEAAGPLGEAAFSGDAHRRSLARTLLLECAARTGDGDVLVEVVAKLALRSVNEQDPVRGSLLEALAALRPRHLDDALAEPLGRLATAAIESRDSSPRTRRALRALAARVLRHAGGPALNEWAMDVYVRLVAHHAADGLAGPPETAPEPRSRRRVPRRRPVADDHRLDRVLRRGREHDLLDRLRPHLRAARERGDFSLAVALAAALHRRAHGLEELQDELRAAVRRAPDALARTAAHLWLDDPATREERAAELLGAGGDAIVHPRAWQVAARRRTDLLVPSLDGGPPADWAPEVAASDAGRWTPAQRDRVRALLLGRAAEESLPVAARLAAVGSLGRLPGTFEDLAAWAGEKENVLAEAALEALAHGGEPVRALEALLTGGRGLASPVAVAAMGRCCARVPPGPLGDLLNAALTGPGSKITVRKQAARQLERHRPPGAAGLLLAAWRDPGLHRDVRVAVAVALRHMPEAPGALDALDDAAGPYAGEIMHRTLFQAQPWEYALEHRPRYAALVRRLLQAADGPGVRFRAARAFGAWVHWYEGGPGEIIAAVGDPGDPAGRRDLPVFLSLLDTGTIRDEVVDVLDRLLAAGTDTEARSRVTRIAQALSGDRVPEPLARRAADRMARHPLYLAASARLTVSRLPVAGGRGGTVPERLGEELEAGLLTLAGRLRDRPLVAARLCDQQLRHRLRGYSTSRVPPPLLLPIVRRLLEEDHAAAGLMAIALAAIGGPDAGWTDDWRAVLERLRGSGNVDIAAGAWEIEAGVPTG
ncbi:hypothetical protein [Actinomadura rugatobispora]|uniref:HEAT repeat domain-containing protein n=1 Tax=Actinomadura rugatobispora TaxID=1994 RepID=A0ABW0ZQJ6_9ACTN|nr:hypothetical protein GCM10010200_102580 [Actinomadura rugatobispora]